MRIVPSCERRLLTFPRGSENQFPLLEQSGRGDAYKVRLCSYLNHARMRCLAGISIKDARRRGTTDAKPLWASLCRLLALIGNVV